MSDQREAIAAAFQRRAEMEREQPAPSALPELDAPEDWPHRFATYQEARGFVTRVRANGSGEAKVIAAELGVHVNSIRRAVANVLMHTGSYDPEGWRRYERERRAEGRKRFLDYCRERDREKQAKRTQIVQHRDAVAEQRRVADMEIEELLAEGELHTPTLVHSPSPTRLTRAERQRKLNAKTRMALRSIT